MKDDRQGHAERALTAAPTRTRRPSTVETLMAERGSTRAGSRRSRPAREHAGARLHARARRLHGAARCRHPAARRAHRAAAAELDIADDSLVALDNEQQQRRDERAEAELRAAVGELTGEEWTDIRTSRQRDRAALTARARRAGARAPAHAGAAQRGRSGVRRRATRSPSSRRRSRRRRAPSAPAVALDKHAAPQRRSPPARGRAAARRAPPRRDRRRAHSRTANAVRRRGIAPTPSVTPAADEPRADADSRRRREAAAFDELAFLSSVVNTPAGAAAHRRPTSGPAAKAHAQRRDRAT